MGIQTGEKRDFYFSGKLMFKPGVDLVIADFPDGLPVPGVSDPPTQVPAWNQQVKSFIKFVIGFCGGYLHDDGALLIFGPDSTHFKKELIAFLNNNNLKEMKEWSIINALHLTHPIDPSSYVRFFCKSA